VVAAVSAEGGGFNASAAYARYTDRSVVRSSGGGGGGGAVRCAGPSLKPPRRAALPPPRAAVGERDDPLRLPRLLLLLLLLLLWVRLGEREWERKEGDRLLDERRDGERSRLRLCSRSRLSRSRRTSRHRSRERLREPSLDRPRLWLPQPPQLLTQCYRVQTICTKLLFQRFVRYRTLELYTERIDRHWA
jgi:hypothetical protein